MKLIFLILNFVFVSCAHHESKLIPEVGSDGAKSVKNGVVYLIPPNHPGIKMKLVSLGPNKENLLHLRMYFFKVGELEKAFLDPKEQAVRLGESDEWIYPSRIHASGKAKPVVKLSGADKGSVELLFPLPSGGHDYSRIAFRWKIHYQTAGESKLMERTEKYSSVDNYDQHSPDDYSADGDFPYEEAWLLPVGWMEPEMLWW